MNLNQLASSQSTSVELKHPVTQALIGVTIHGFTPDSKEWANKNKQLLDPTKKQELFFEKGGRSSVEIDPSDSDKRLVLLSAMVTGIDGIDDWTFSPEAVTELFENPLHQWMLEQWRAHLDDRKNFFAKPVASVNSGLDVTAGSMEAQNV